MNFKIVDSMNDETLLEWEDVSDTMPIPLEGELVRVNMVDEIRLLPVLDVIYDYTNTSQNQTVVVIARV